MSVRSAVNTRSKVRKMAEESDARRRDATIVSDSGLLSESAPGSPSVAPTVTSAAAPNITLTGGRVIDYSEKPAEGVSRQTVARSTRSSRVSSKNSRKGVEFLRKRAEYEAERDLVHIRESLVKKRMEVEIAEIEANAESNDSNSDVDTAHRVEEWIKTTPQASQSDTALFTSAASRARTASQAPLEVAAPYEASRIQDRNVSKVNLESDMYRVPAMLSENNVSCPHRTPVCNTEPMQTLAHTEAVRFSLPDNYPTFTTPVASGPQVSTLESVPQRHGNSGVDVIERRRQSSNDRDRKIDKLAEAITNMARPHPVPRQAYELPHFSGDPADWISYRNMYWDTTDLYNFRAHENIARLKSSLHGEAKISVEDLLRSSRDPTEIMRALEEEYGHPTVVLQYALKKVRDLPKVSESGQELRKFSSTVRNCVSLLKNIKADGYLNNPQIVSELLNKLTPVQRAQYGDFAMGLDNSQGVDLRISPSLEILSQFLIHVTRSTSYYLQPIVYETEHSKPPAKEQQTGGRTRPANAARPVTNKPQMTHRVNTQSDEAITQKECVMCHGKHVIEDCDQFKKLNVQERWELIKQQKVCFNCLSVKHTKRFCRAKKCKKCDYRHHVLLHEDKPKQEVKSERVSNIGEWRATALLKIVPVTVCNKGSNNDQCYALLDDGATVSLIDSSLATNLTGPRVPLMLKTAGGHGVSDLTSRVVQVRVKGPNGQYHNIKCRTIVNLNLPTQTVTSSVISDNAHLRDLGCAEMRGAKPLLLVGQDNWELLVPEDIRRGRSGKPVASLTKLGWVIHGPFDNASITEAVNCTTVSLPDLHNLVKSQFELESIGISQVTRKHKDVERAVQVLESTSQRTPDKTQWEVGLLWKQDNILLPDNYKQARQRLYGIEKRMRKDARFAETYANQFNRLLDESYARKVEGKVDSSPVWYLPHFGVVNPNKPGKLRLVFDAAATSQGTCLNDNLLTGPDLLNSLLGILIRFRIGPIAFSGDIADMFLRVKIRAQDQGAQLFLWRGADDSREPDTYAMTSMIFGAASSPTTAIYILNKNASEWVDVYPEAVAAIRDKHYMDDYLDSAWSVEQANSLIEQVTKIHASGGFVIRGWATNSSELREKLKVDMPDKVPLEKEIDRLSTRGNWRWVPTEDNPADRATRLSWPDDHAAWLSGPSFLCDPQERWPACHEPEAAEADLERIQRVHIAVALAGLLLVYERYSSWKRVQRTMARTLMFIELCRQRRATPELRLHDLEEAHLHLMRLCQNDSFHLELAATLSADSAILALRRLIARRGQPAHLYSDQGTNFMRAPREEVLYTLLTEVELIVNSRPLSYVYDDHEQPEVLTPNHLLLGTASGSTPFTSSNHEDIDSRRQWRRVNARADMFWRRWLREYLPTLQRREKWTNSVPNVRVDDVVVIVDNNRERNAWTKGVVQSVYQGNDGIVRVIDIKTVNGVLRRPVAKIIVLPTEMDVSRLNPFTGGGM